MRFQFSRRRVIIELMYSIEPALGFYMFLEILKLFEAPKTCPFHLPQSPTYRKSISANKKPPQRPPLKTTLAVSVIVAAQTLSSDEKYHTFRDNCLYFIMIDIIYNRYLN